MATVVMTILLPIWRSRDLTPRSLRPFRQAARLYAAGRQTLGADDRRAVCRAAGILIAPLPGPGGIPVIAVGLMLILKSSFWAKRQFIRAQYARPKWVYPFRRLMRKKPEFAPVFWQQALRAERIVTKRSSRRLSSGRKSVRRYFRKLFR
ncbi:hypothetical protein [Brevundimonas vesicularis]|uniref:hypothetical protein n=1 Tax=Brevundimonas vesicularis TaxID=41276 RepID=UPI00384E5F12